MPRRNCVLFLKNLVALRPLFLVPIAFLAPLPLLDDGAVSRCSYVVVVMAILWLTEALPIPVTALMPVFLIPMFGVLPGKKICAAYVNDTSMLFLGGLIVAVAVEEVNLHKRIAMAILSLVGSQSNLLMLGLMIPTWFLSMWISNTAATSMMVPIITALATQTVELETNEITQNGGVKNEGFEDMEIDESGKENEGKIPNGNTTHNGNNDVKQSKRKAAEMKKMSKGFALCVAYAANIGGVATLTGTPPNLILQGQANELYSGRAPGTDSGITFAKWMGFGLPLSIIVLVLAWIWLQIMFLGSSCFRKQDPAKRKAIKLIIDEEKKKLGPIKFGEVVVMVLFGILAALWIFRDIPGFGGWKVLFKEDINQESFVRDSTAAMLIAVMLFLLPAHLPEVTCSNKYEVSEQDRKPRYRPILTWKKTVVKVPWGVIILLGGGFALASATSASGLSKRVGCSLRVLDNFEPWVMNLILSLAIAAATEITSNSATATILMPIMAELAVNTGSHPLYLMITAAVACSFAFMLPVATPPNAIVYSTGYIKIPDMALAGLMMNAIAVLILNLGINTWGKALFDLDRIPEIFGNSTKSSCDVVGSTAAPLLSNFTTSLINNAVNMTTESSNLSLAG
ncbi:Na(+)/citrate cotransporter-like isoform X2 [Saccostrea echinata]|uniref:Na(+)/citrate cotransporter-like isoform X2 n=1 Tax=Saccostrea echinata TaxID=191078 RepID=UPI002A81C8B9|nr:Na(+)/citrate cotransporter-like isoform X2 [Saccostrea echinata]